MFFFCVFFSTIFFISKNVTDHCFSCIKITFTALKSKAVVGGTAGPAMAGPLFWPKIALAEPFFRPNMIFFLPGHFSG